MKHMKCPFCSHRGCRIVDSRPRGDGCIRRRRLCGNCGSRFTTVEEFDRDLGHVPTEEEVVAGAINRKRWQHEQFHRHNGRTPS